MHLTQYIRSRDMTATEFAAIVGVHVSQVSRWMSGETRPHWTQIARIREVTLGAVGPNDWLEGSSLAESCRSGKASGPDRAA